jgi:hypothetical protein
MGSVLPGRKNPVIYLLNEGARQAVRRIILLPGHTFGNGLPIAGTPTTIFIIR